MLLMRELKRVYLLPLLIAKGLHLIKLGLNSINLGSLVHG
jgi:hypothetical protein